MSNIIHKIRAKSPETKHKLAVGSALVITAMIVSVWMLAMGNSKTDEIAKENSTSEDLKPLFMIFKNAKEGFGDIKASAASYKEERKKAKDAVVPTDMQGGQDVIE